MLRNVWSGKCLEVYQYSTENLAYLTQYDCYRGLNSCGSSSRTSTEFGCRDRPAAVRISR